MIAALKTFLGVLSGPFRHFYPLINSVPFYPSPYIILFLLLLSIFTIIIIPLDFEFQRKGADHRSVEKNRDLRVFLRSRTFVLSCTAVPHLFAKKN